MMKLSNTMIMNETLLPSSKKAFTLAEVLITLSILGIVAALTIPSLINRQSDMAAIVKLKKAISTYEQMAGVYMVENETTDLANVLGTNCGSANAYFKITNQSGCSFTTGDGALWVFDSTGNPVVFDSAKKPRFGVYMWAHNGEVNAQGSTPDSTAELYVPAATDVPQASAYTSTDANAASPFTPQHKFFNALYFINTDSKTLISGDKGAGSPRAAMTSADQGVNSAALITD